MAPSHLAKAFDGEIETVLVLISDQENCVKMTFMGDEKKMEM